jgi:hypothetical protein
MLSAIRCALNGFGAEYCSLRLMVSGYKSALSWLQVKNPNQKGRRIQNGKNVVWKSG